MPSKVESEKAKAREWARNKYGAKVKTPPRKTPPTPTRVTRASATHQLAFPVEDPPSMAALEIGSKTPTSAKKQSRSSASTPVLRYVGGVQGVARSHRLYDDEDMELDAREEEEYVDEESFLTANSDSLEEDHKSGMVYLDMESLVAMEKEAKIRYHESKKRAQDDETRYHESKKRAQDDESRYHESKKRALDDESSYLKLKSMVNEANRSMSGLS